MPHGWIHGSAHAIGMAIPCASLGLMLGTIGCCIYFLGLPLRSFTTEYSAKKASDSNIAYLAAVLKSSLTDPTTTGRKQPPSLTRHQQHSSRPCTTCIATSSLYGRADLLQTSDFAPSALSCLFARLTAVHIFFDPGQLSSLSTPLVTSCHSITIAIHRIVGHCGPLNCNGARLSSDRDEGSPSSEPRAALAGSSTFCAKTAIHWDFSQVCQNTLHPQSFKGNLGSTPIHLLHRELLRQSSTRLGATNNSIEQQFNLTSACAATRR